MKKIFVSVLISSFFIIYFGCERENVVNSVVHTTKGVYVLYEGDFTPGSGDYSFINTNNDSVANSVFSNSNNGAALGLFPDGIFLYLQNLYISTQGSYGGHGRMVNISRSTNKLLDTSAAFGISPYNFDLANNNFYVTNFAGSTVTKLSQTLDIIRDGIQVGPSPSEIIHALRSSYISKKSYTTENTLAIIDEFTDLVTKDTFPAPPVSAADMFGNVHVSTYSWKKLYVLDSFNVSKKVDSIAITINQPAIGEIVSDGSQTLYIVGVSDTSFQSNIGNKLYKYNALTRQLDPNPIIQLSSPNDIYGIAYDQLNNLIYIANSKGGSINGEVLVYNTNGTLIKTYPIGGKYPRKFVFYYENS